MEKQKQPFIQTTIEYEHRQDGDVKYVVAIKKIMLRGRQVLKFEAIQSASHRGWPMV